MKFFANCYWTFILILQTILIIQKVLNDGFYIWNIVALVCATVFLFSRLKKNRVLVNSEVFVSLFIAINGVMTGISQIINLYSLLTHLVSLFVVVASIYMAHFIWKTEDNIAK